MELLDSLLELVAYLQHGVDVAHGRRMLLEYIHANSGARLALLFLADIEQQAFDLLESVSTAGASPTPTEEFRIKRERPKPLISLDGLFGTVLHTHGLLSIPDIHTDERSLKEERDWIQSGSSLLLGGVGMPTNRQGVLVLCFGSEEKGKRAANSEHLLICMTLLSAYLSDNLAEQRAAIDQERSRIARDIHDGAAQEIAHVVHKLEFIQRVFEKQPEVALREVGRASELLEGSLKELRQSISSLLPPQVEELGIATALHQLLNEYTRNEPDMKLYTDIEGLHMFMLPPALEGPLFRFVQEALHNVRKHAQASSVHISIHLLPRLLLAEVSDDGKGFQEGRILRRPGKDVQTGQRIEHIGLYMMGERIRKAGGSWEIQSSLGKGTTIRARFPLTGPSSVRLTRREREVLQLLVEGLTNRAIAQQLFVSTETVKSHVHHIMQKLQVKDRTQAAVVATKEQWFKLHSSP